MKNLRNLKRLGLFFMALLLTVACGKKDHNKKTGASEVSGPLHVISREEGSGTRGAFTEITGILVKNDAGEEVDETSEEVTIVNSTEAVVSSVNSDETAIVKHGVEFMNGQMDVESSLGEGTIFEMNIPYNS